ncbi:chloride channel protein 2 isoform X6 [Oratosquilla oratoria]|uniref:chloride channel protein 2 isoform X6 n=1 Tax=Oratosquilla oratoria TaxID=337810 RepID=UPI003F76AA7F
MVVNMATSGPFKEGEKEGPSSSPSSSSSPPEDGTEEDKVATEEEEDEVLSEAVLGNLESLRESLADTPLLSLPCDDKPSVIGSHGLPLMPLAMGLDDDFEAPVTPLGSPDLDEDDDDDVALPPELVVPEAPLDIIHHYDSEEESPVVDLTTPLKYDFVEAMWKPTEERKEPLRLTPPPVIPTIDYLQVPPHHRAKLRQRRRRVSFHNELADPEDCCQAVVDSPSLPCLNEEKAAGAAVIPRPAPGVVDGADISLHLDLNPEPREEDTLLTPPAQPNGALQGVAGAERSIVSANNCVIKIPQKQRKPSFSNIDIPCYHRRPSGQALDVNFDYTFTVMYGRYTKDLGQFAKAEAKKLKKEEKKSIEGAASGLRPYRGRVATKCLSVLGTVWRATFARVGEDWVFLALLGVVMAIISFLMDYGIAVCNKARIWMYRDLASHTVLQYLAWVSLPVFLILFSAGFVHILAPQAIGSGIPEMKTILRGVVLKEYLTFKTLIAKVIGLTATLGSGLPLGKEGPFVHIASIVATLLSKAVTSFKGIYENESRNTEMLAAACAVGVACSFAAPIGGVLFSIEVTSVYFAVRNYWRGFFAAVCGAMMFRLLAVWFNDEATLTPLFKTSFKVEIPFDPQELFAFALIGVLCGFLGALFVWVHRQYVIFMRKNKKMKMFLQKSRLLYPLLLTTVIMTLTCPPGLGQFIAGHLTTHHQVIELFSNMTWTKEEHTVSEFEIVENWRTPWTGIFVNLLIYMAFTFCGSVVASTLPVPSGIFIPVFKIGAALGRIVGEAMASGFPNGLRYGGHNHIIIPGGYSIVGAAALAGAVTHTISTSVIVFELTGQITHILPVMIAVLIANGIAQLLQPSVYDSIIQIKKLPYLPDILTATSGAYNIYVEDFMIRDVKYIWYGITHRQLKNILKENKKIRSLPLVDSPDSMILLGSIQRSELITILEEHLGKDRRLRVINKWKFAAQNKLPSVRRRSSCVTIRAIEAEQLKEDEARRIESVKGKTAITSALLSAGLTAIAEAGGVSGAMAAAASLGMDLPANVDTNTTTVSLPVSNKSSTTSSGDPSTIMSSNIPTTVITPAVPDYLRELPRRPSRFEVTKVESQPKNESSVTLQIDPVEIPAASDSNLDKPLSPRSGMPRKSILKKTNSFILHPTPSSPCVSPQHTPYATVHAGDSSQPSPHPGGLRQAFEAVLRKTSLLKLDERNNQSNASAPTTPNSTKRSVPMERMVEMTLEEQRRWEEEELSKEVEFSKCHIDPAPFQLVERTSLLKVHSLFSMLGLNHAYVTAIGRLIGVVALKELRTAVESTNAGDLPKPRRERGVGGSFREKFLRSTIRRKLRKAIEDTNSGDFSKPDTPGGAGRESPKGAAKSATSASTPENKKD